MAKSAVKAGGTSRIRFVMFDAEVGDGEIGQITQAIQNALRGSVQVTTARLPAPAALKAPEFNGHVPEAEVEFEQDEEIVDETPAAARQPRAKRTVAKTPKVVEIDMNAEISLATFASDKDAGSQAKKYMICAAWLKEHRGIDAVTENHIYTCFKSMDWSTNIPNFAQPLRDLKAKQQYFEKSDKGYEINHIGIDFVKKLTRKGD